MNQKEPKWKSAKFPDVVYRGRLACNPCPLCGDLKKRTSKLCLKCRRSNKIVRLPKEYAIVNPHDRPGVIYKITNTVNGKVYIGKTTIGIDQRLRQHFTNARNGWSNYLYRAMRKYGYEYFVIEAIDAGVCERELDSKEIQWIAALGSTDRVKGYNCTIGGDGRVHTPSSRARAKGVRSASQETREKLRIINTGRKMRPEDIAKMSAARRGKKQSPESNEKRSITLRLRWSNDAALRERASRVQRARWTDELRARHSDGLRKRYTPELRAKLAAAQRRRWTPEFKAEWSKRQKSLWNPEKCANHSEHQARVWETKQEAKRKCSMASKSWWDAHPEAKAAMSQRVWSEESKAKARVAAMKRWDKEGTR